MVTLPACRQTFLLAFFSSCGYDEQRAFLAHSRGTVFAPPGEVVDLQLILQIAPRNVRQYQPTRRNQVSKSLSHEEISERFVGAKVVDFGAMGRFISEFGATLAVNDQGWHGVNIGRFNILACMMPAADVARLVGDLRAASLTAKALEGVAEASLPR